MSKVGVRLMGGLGNQLFQAAFIYSYGKKYNKEFGYYNIDPNQHSNIDYTKTVFPFLKKINLNKNHWIFREPHALTYNNLSNVSNECLFDGYFQCPKYFEAYRDDLIQLFQFTTLPFEIKDNSIFIHVRRGDYLKGPCINIHHLGLDQYYLKCIEFIRKINSEIHFYIVSDDINYCKTLFKNIDNITFVDNLNELETMTLMKSCKYGGICSNSSFSWWGSYLNNSPNKICIFPNNWFKKGSNEYRDKYDIYYEGCYIVDLNTFEIKQKIK